MASPLLQKMPLSPLAPKTPVFRRLTVAAAGEKPRISTPTCVGPSPDVVRSGSLQLGTAESSRFSPSSATTRRRDLEQQTPKSSTLGVGVRQIFPSLSCTPNYGGRISARLLNNQSSPNLLSSPAVALKFSSTQACSALVQSPCRMANYSDDRRKLYHQDSPPESIPGRTFSQSGKEELGGCPYSASAAGYSGREAPVSSRKSSLPPLATPSVTPRSTPKLGNGGFGSVFFGKYGGVRVAIKQLYNRKHDDDRAKEESFCAELNAFRLQHPNIVRILTFTSCGPITQVVFEYAGPKNLQQMLLQDSDPVSSKKRLLFCSEVAEALHYCHSHRILHLDVKAANVFVNETEDHCKLGDFGCSRLLPPDSEFLPAAESLAGTLMFKAPELLKGREISAKADTYSFGILVWQCLTRKLPFEGFHPHTVVFLVVSRGLRPDCAGLKERMEGTRELSLLEMAQRCWDQDFALRPHFQNICTRLNRLIHDC